MPDSNYGLFGSRSLRCQSKACRCDRATSARFSESPVPTRQVEQVLRKIVQVIAEKDGVTTYLGLDPRVSGGRHVASLATGRRLDRHADLWEMTKPPS